MTLLFDGEHPLQTLQDDQPLARHGWGECMAQTQVLSRNSRISTSLLLQFCRQPGTPDYPMANVDYDEASALNVVREVFPDIAEKVVGKRVIDFGCGGGCQAVAYAKAGARSVIGVEIEAQRATTSEARVRREGLSGCVTIERRLRGGEAADIIVSQNSFEHFLEPEATLRELRNALAPGGEILITFGPPWFAPTGAHMGFFCNLPWAQLLFSEATVMDARSYFRSDGATTFRDAGLGKMSVRRFEEVVRSSGLQMLWHRYDCIKGINLVRSVPVLRELAINRISCILQAAPSSAATH